MPAITASSACGFLNSFPQHIKATKQRVVLDVELDRTNPWGFFDGATQNNICGGGYLLYLLENHFFKLIVGLGEGNLKLLLVFATYKDCKILNFMGDSLNVINWINGTQHCIILRLDSILRSAREVLNSFDAYSCRHIYWENNREAKKASKEGLQLAMGQWKMKEHRGDTIWEYYHRPFIE